MEGPLLWHLVASCPVKGVISGVELSQTRKEQTAGGCVLITRPVTGSPFFLGSTPRVSRSSPCLVPTRSPTYVRGPSCRTLAGSSS